MPGALEWYRLVWEATRDPRALEPLGSPGGYEALRGTLESRGLPGLPARFYAALAEASRGLALQLLQVDPSDPGDCEATLAWAGEAERLAVLLERDARQEAVEYRLPRWALELALSAVGLLRAAARLARRLCGDV